MLMDFTLVGDPGQLSEPRGRAFVALAERIGRWVRHDFGSDPNVAVAALAGVPACTPQSPSLSGTSTTPISINLAEWEQSPLAQAWPVVPQANWRDALGPYWLAAQRIVISDRYALTPRARPYLERLAALTQDGSSAPPVLLCASKEDTQCEGGDAERWNDNRGFLEGKGWHVTEMSRTQFEALHDRFFCFLLSSEQTEIWKVITLGRGVTGLGNGHPGYLSLVAPKDSGELMKLLNP